MSGLIVLYSLLSRPSLSDLLDNKAVFYKEEVGYVQPITHSSLT